MTRAPCRRRTGRALLRAEKFGDLITADHKVFNEECESRDNHRYAVVVRDLATQRIQNPIRAKKDFRGDGPILEGNLFQGTPALSVSATNVQGTLTGWTDLPYNWQSTDAHDCCDIRRLKHGQSTTDAQDTLQSSIERDTNDQTVNQ